MLNTININLKTDIKTDRPTTLPITLMSQDVNNNQFILRFTSDGESVALDSTYTVEILTKFTKSGTSRLTSAVVRQGYATWGFDTAYITQDETVYNYVYVRKSGSLVVSADANCFVFNVGLSEVDKGAGKVAETYDENYQKYLDEFKGNVDFEEIAQSETERIQAEQARKEAELLREESYEQKVDTAIVEADVVEKVDNKVTELTPQISNLTAQLAQKAKQSELEIERARISNLTANAGNTDGNAELLDVRVGFDGETYATAGEATRAVGKHIIEIENHIEKELNYAFIELPNGVANSVDLAHDTLIKRIGYTKIRKNDIVSIDRISSHDNPVMVAISREFDDVSFTNLSTGAIRIEGKEEIPNDGSEFHSDNTGKYFTADSQKIGFLLPVGTTLQEAKTQLEGTKIYYQLKEEQLVALSEITPNTAQIARVANHIEKELSYSFEELPNGVTNGVDLTRNKLIKRIGFETLSKSDIESIVLSSTSAIDPVMIAISRVFNDTAFTNLSIGAIRIEGKEEIPNDGSEFHSDNTGKYFTADSQKIGFLFPMGTTLQEARDQLDGINFIYQLKDEQLIDPSEVTPNTKEIAKLRASKDETDNPPLRNLLDGTINVPSKQESTSVVSFISDDGRIEDYTILKPIFDSENIPFASAVVTDNVGSSEEYMDITHLQELVAGGHEILSHCKQHRNLNSLSKEQVEWQLSQSKIDLLNMGINVRHIAYPNGGYNNFVKKTARKYYESGYLYMTSGKTNTQPYDSFAIDRISLGAYFNNGTSEFPITNTFSDYYKPMVDKALATDDWLVITLHPGAANGDFDAEQEGYLVETIQYIKSLGIPIETPSQVLDRQGNILETASYNEDYSKETLLRIGGNGKLYAELGTL